MLACRKGEKLEVMQGIQLLFEVHHLHTIPTLRLRGTVELRILTQCMLYGPETVGRMVVDCGKGGGMSEKGSGARGQTL